MDVYGNQYNENRRCKQYLSAAGMGYRKLRQYHLEEYCLRFEQYRMYLGANEKSRLNTHSRIISIQNGEKDPCFTAQSFQFSRYLGFAIGRMDDSFYTNNYVTDNNSLKASAWGLHYINRDNPYNYTVCELNKIVTIENDCIILLPAVTDIANEGWIRGLTIPGQHKIDIYWDKGMFLQAFIHAGSDDRCRLKIRNGINVEAGMNDKHYKSNQNGILELELKTGKDYIIEPI
jgi:hypothetical protein